MARLVDPPRLTERSADVPESIRELLRSAQRDTPTSSEIASLKLKLAPLLNAPPVPSGLMGPLNGSMAGLGKIVAVTTLVAASGFTYWALQNRTTQVEITPSSKESQDNGSQPMKTPEKGDVDRIVPSIATVPEPTDSVSDLDPMPLGSKGETVHEAARKARAERVRKGNVATQMAATNDPQAPTDRSIYPENAQNEMDEAVLLDLARKALPNDPARTLRLTFEHYRKFNTGVLGEEREVLIIEALVRLGRKDEAQARTRNFLTVYPQSVYRRRLTREVFNDK